VLVCTVVTHGNRCQFIMSEGCSLQSRPFETKYAIWFRCVRLARFENDRTISFIPPDGAFDLMTYRLSTQVHSEVFEIFLKKKKTTTLVTFLSI
jgi:hypothetical protein